ncbi:uncharacterized protein KD926_000284 [Aspergillus affinis]|uniref:uncharacterized protein n=1 Tax=Aspergillus affinis TaxID=1070780 RepID=UPI0022FF20FC|nr:uncharacterized protein KD926_000284 [Aspergillus affinis]KAI9037489.1 hypothetical protein KD926_000284 [Aspergillus affinis]
MILKHALLAPYAPPTNPWTGADKRQPLKDIEYKAWSHGPRYTLYDTLLDQRLATRCQALLLINRQIRDETKDILRRLGKPSYQLDVMVVNEWELWPTWLSVPVLRSHLDEVNVNFRIFGHCIVYENWRHTRGDGGHDGLEWCFYAMLERFVVHGPLTEPAMSDQQAPRFYINTLTLNIESDAFEKYLPSDPRWEEYKGARERHHRSIPQPDSSFFPLLPEWLAKDLYCEIDRLIGYSYHPDRYGDILYDNVGKIRMLQEGRLVREVDLAERVARSERESLI